MPDTLQTLAFGFPGNWEWIILLLLGLLLFGRRLPEVGRSLGKSIVEFKKGIKGIEDEIDEASKDDRQLDSQKQSYSTDARAVPQNADPGPQQNPGPGTPPAAPQQPTT